MEYTGLISVIVALTNLIPNFGPIIGGVISGFFLLLVNPYHALMFIIFTAILQTVDAYIIKPKLFGNSLGVSGLMILISVVVFGKIFGIIGIVLAIPAAAIIEYAYSEIFLTHLENRKKKREEAAAKTQQQ
ncbi:MAG: AI-2E family transporter, partial [Solobacterium sp.]|nr:AI-2E family transporter [Solobacterium sp.]